MKKKEERFMVTLKEGSTMKDDGVKQILVDRETGVNYLVIKSPYGFGIVPLLNTDGKVVISKLDN